MLLPSRVIGPLIDSALTFLGGLLGGLLGQRLSETLRSNLTLTFGVASMAMGVTMIVKMASLPPVIIALIFGSIAGELLGLELRINAGAAKVRCFIDGLVSAKGGAAISHEEFLSQFVALLVLFCASGTGIFGAMNEGITGNASLLMAKSVLDFFTAGIFATRLGFSVAVVAIPQFIIQASLFYLGRFILPLTTPALVADFSSCGGIVMLATGFRIAQIKAFCVANLLPVLLFVMPISHLWSKWMP